MAQKTATITLSLVRDDGGVVTSADIASYLLEEKPHAGTTFATIYSGTDIGPHVVNGITGGDWDFQATLKDTKGGPDLVLAKTVTVPVGALTGSLTVTLA